MPTMYNRPRQYGFTLIELSIVLVIIGLVVGGVLVGRDLIRAAELRSVISDLERFETAGNTFRLKYNAIPGDMASATVIWGAADPDPTTCISTVGTGTQTCNGNGDGRIGYPPPPDLTWSYEEFRFWQHLSNAELIPGKYNGVWSGGVAQIGVNVPASKISRGGYSLENGTGYGTTNWVGEFWPATDTPNTILEFGGYVPGDILYAPVLSPKEALSLDSKIDDGLPATGRLLTYMSVDNPGCTTSDVPATSRYVVSDDILCALIFKLTY